VSRLTVHFKTLKGDTLRAYTSPFSNWNVPVILHQDAHFARERTNDLTSPLALLYTPALACLLARDMGDSSQGHRTIDGGPEIGTGGLLLYQPDHIRRESILGCLARGLALTNKPSIGLYRLLALAPALQVTELVPVWIFRVGRSISPAFAFWTIEAGSWWEVFQIYPLGQAQAVGGIMWDIRSSPSHRAIHAPQCEYSSRMPAPPNQALHRGGPTLKSIR